VNHFKTQGCLCPPPPVVVAVTRVSQFRVNSARAREFFKLKDADGEFLIGVQTGCACVERKGGVYLGQRDLNCLSELIVKRAAITGAHHSNEQQRLVNSLLCLSPEIGG
jgi:hypothetical protein